MGKVTIYLMLATMYNVLLESIFVNIDFLYDSRKVFQRIHYIQQVSSRTPS
jgi:hypothetical protein